MSRLKLPALPRVAAVLPTLPVSAAFVTLFNLAAWRALKDMDWATVRDKRFCVHVRDLGLKTHFSVGRDGLRPQFGDHADVTFTASSRDFLRLALRLEDPDTLFFNRRLLIEGNTDLGLTVKNMLDAVEFEALLAALPGPLAYVMRNLRERMADDAGQVALSGR
ncbi:MAG: SCP2 sterol-binding domain-containing protein [Gallionellaceae bacterium]|nr:SCP2 sterol-binding domain-containing protein [Gallionellaceae bacterium]